MTRDTRIKDYKDSLEYKNPELARQWHPTKNLSLLPSMVGPHSSKNIWWIYPYDDPNTGKHFEFEWKDTVNHRTAGRGCPFLTGRKIWVGFNDLMTTNPDICREWHYTKNEITPYDVSKGSTQKVWWIYPYDDPNTGKHFDFEWEESVGNRVSHNYKCPYLSGQSVWTGYNDLATTHPEIAQYWNYDKNAFTPQDISHGYNKKVWWKYPYDDPNTGKHFEFEWEARITNLVRGHICPFLSNYLVWTGYNDLATTHPHLLNEWDFENNKSISPYTVSFGYSKKVWWKYPYDDPNTGEHFEFKWQAKIINRIKGHTCPYLSGQAVWQGYNDLATTHPHIAKYWNYKKNKLTPHDVSYGYTKKVWWIYPYDDPNTGKHFEFEWNISINSVTSKSNTLICPFLSNQRIWRGYNDFPTFYPELLEEWHNNKNKSINPYNYSAKSDKKVWWRCMVCGHEWRTQIKNRTIGRGCPNYLQHNKSTI